MLYTHTYVVKFPFRLIRFMLIMSLADKKGKVC